jgi:hypothetical protein
MQITVSAAVLPRIGGPSWAWSKLAILAACLGLGQAAARARQLFYWDTNGGTAGSGTVTVSDSQGAHGMTFRSGQTTLSSGTLGIGAGNRNVESTALSPLTIAGLISPSVIIAAPQTCLALARTGIAAAACAVRRHR